MYFCMRIKGHINTVKSSDCFNHSKISIIAHSRLCLKIQEPRQKESVDNDPNNSTGFQVAQTQVLFKVPCYHFSELHKGWGEPNALSRASVHKRVLGRGKEAGVLHCIGDLWEHGCPSWIVDNPWSMRQASPVRLCVFVEVLKFMEAEVWLDV